ncbi:IclR family transcriptional regulator [Enemella evansiae]|uniref:IclR family transcriptional regulator n=1 Tax=Enemella evansiae TaxID=2016499 RepID=UPI000B974AB5|nr:IclR family transcriptional regulator [Enemella evansiae]OYN93841.1 IclR family transcriptional regulator [Enemella evansiae]OYO14932.1 IclR family transcriptional regulator [Enemella evansiae]
MTTTTREAGAPTLSTVSNAVEVMEALAGGPVTLRELAALTGLPRQTAYRIVRTLISHDWVRKESDSDRYRMTYRIWSLATQAFGQIDVRQDLREQVRRLARVGGETVHLAVYEDGEAVYIDKAEGSEPICTRTNLGSRAAAHAVSTGKVLLAFQDHAEQERVLGEELRAYTEDTVTDPARLRRQLAQITTRGYGTNSGEWRPGVGGIAVPILGPDATVLAALGFTGPADRVRARQDRLRQALEETARSYQKSLGAS